MPMLKEVMKGSVVIIMLILAVYFIFGPIIVGGFRLFEQCYEYLNDASWSPDSMINFITNFKIDDELYLKSLALWAENPNKLYGLHSILSEVNAGLTLIIFGVSNCFIFVLIEKFFGKEIESFMQK